MDQLVAPQPELFMHPSFPWMVVCFLHMYAPGCALHLPALAAFLLLCCSPAATTPTLCAWTLECTAFIASTPTWWCFTSQLVPSGGRSLILLLWQVLTLGGLEGTPGLQMPHDVH